MYAFTSDVVVRVPASKVNDAILPSEATVVFKIPAGRTISGAFHPKDGKLYFLDIGIGLLSWDPATSIIEVLSTEANGRIHGFVDDLDFGLDGTVYFSDATVIKPYGFDEHGNLDIMSPSFLDFLTLTPTGRIISYDPATRRSKVLAEPFYFANGVAVSRDGKSVLTSETAAYRVTKISLADGSKSTFTKKSLPGAPDSISLGKKGKLWVAIAQVLEPSLVGMMKNPSVRKFLSLLPTSLIAAKPYGLFVQVNAETGVIEKTYHDSKGVLVGMVTSIAEHKDSLYLGTLTHDYIIKCPIQQ